MLKFTISKKDQLTYKGRRYRISVSNTSCLDFFWKKVAPKQIIFFPFLVFLGLLGIKRAFSPILDIKIKCFLLVKIFCISFKGNSTQVLSQYMKCSTCYPNEVNLYKKWLTNDSDLDKTALLLLICSILVFS